MNNVLGLTSKLSMNRFIAGPLPVSFAGKAPEGVEVIRIDKKVTQYGGLIRAFVMF
jgi:hypothetical protein